MKESIDSNWRPLSFIAHHISCLCVIEVRWFWGYSIAVIFLTLKNWWPGWKNGYVVLLNMHFDRRDDCGEARFNKWAFYIRVSAKTSITPIQSILASETGPAQSWTARTTWDRRLVEGWNASSWICWSGMMLWTKNARSMMGEDRPKFQMTVHFGIETRRYWLRPSNSRFSWKLAITVESD